MTKIKKKAYNLYGEGEGRFRQGAFNEIYFINKKNHLMSPSLHIFQIRRIKFIKNNNKNNERDR